MCRLLFCFVFMIIDDIYLKRYFLKLISPRATESQQQIKAQYKRVHVKFIDN